MSLAYSVDRSDASLSTRFLSRLNKAAWRWDVDRIRARGITDNVVDLLIGKVNRLPDNTREALKQLACLGNRANTATLVIVHGRSEEVGLVHPGVSVLGAVIHQHPLAPSEQAATLRRRSGRVYRYPEVNKPMVASNRSTGGRSAGSAVARELDKLRNKVKELTLRLEREAKARKLDARLAAEARKAREQLTTEIKALREQGLKLGSQLKSTLGDASKREQALKEARAKVAGLKVELGRKTADLRRKSGELKKLAEESAHRAAAIIRGDAQHATEPVEAEAAAPPAPSGLGSESHPNDKPTPT